MIDLFQARRESHEARELGHEFKIQEGGVSLEVPRVEGQAFYPSGDAPKMTRDGTPMENIKEGLADLPKAVGSAGAGLAAGAAGLPGDLVGLAGGLAKFMFPGDQGRIEAAAETLSKISETAGSEFFLGLYRDFVNNSDASLEDKQMMLDVAEGASFGSIPGAGAVAKGSSDAIRSGLVRAGEAAQARLDEAAGSTTLTSGVDVGKGIDQAIAAAGRAASQASDKLESSALQKFAFYKNKEGDQQIGNKQVIVDIDRQIFETHVRPLIDKGMTFEEFEMGKLPGGLFENFHAAFTSVNGGDYKLTKVDKIDNLQPNKLYALQVDDFNSPEALTRRQTADSDVIPLQADPNQAAGAALADAQVRYFETGNFEPPTAENPVSVVRPTETEPGIIAFHGSGADFNEFRLEMIGTGEGAQAYGYGLYFTDSEDIAKFYKTLVSGNSATAQTLMFDDIAQVLKGKIKLTTNTVLDIINKKTAVDSLPQETQSQIKEILQKNYEEELKKSAGKIYKVGLSPKPDELLDYDLPLSQQPEMLKLIDDAHGDSEIILKQAGLDPATATGGQLVNALGGTAQTIEQQKAGADFLLKAGIPGIKYRAAGSRGAATTDEAAERNYVIFDDKAVKILEKYGIVGPVAITAAAAGQSNDNEDGGI